MNQKVLLSCTLVLLLFLFSQCENNERYYRPDLPEQLCATGIIDIDDTVYYETFHTAGPGDILRDTMDFARSIFFEKSFQAEFADSLNDSLRELSVQIINDNNEIIFTDYYNLAKRAEIKIPDSVRFESGRKYFFHASDKNAGEISAECLVPDLPPPLSLVSLKTGVMMLDTPKEYNGFPEKYARRTAEVEVSFDNADPGACYAIMLMGSYSDSRVEWAPGWGTNLLGFTVAETNTNGFITTLQGRKSLQKIDIKESVHSGGVVIKIFPGSAYFIDGSKIPEGHCVFKLSTFWDPVRYIPIHIKCLRVRIMTIPKEVYLFSKSLYVYNEQSGDPFSELANINGNVVGGNGVIAFCRSRELIVYTGQQGYYFDTFF